jgi:hypothetical protein
MEIYGSQYEPQLSSHWIDESGWSRFVVTHTCVCLSNQAIPILLSELLKQHL